MLLAGTWVEGDQVMMQAFIRTGSAPARNQQAHAQYAATDEMIVERITAGDQLAMRTLFARHQTRIYRFVLRLLRNEAAAEDVVSEVFLDVWRQAGRFEGRSTVSTWLLSIARCKAISAMRRRQTVELDADTIASTPDPADDPEMSLAQKRDAILLRNGLAQLSPAHAEVLDLVYYHGKTVAEAAAILSIPEPTVKTRMFYARKKLAEIVQGELRQCAPDRSSWH
jgi:RNA polymerase sigma-70 factor (ECF subfamily)